jgi:hypothetical protein
MDRSVKADPARRTAAKPWFLRSRAWHHYIGMFIAPSLIFFALTGVAQTFNLHESHVGYTAPALVVAAGSLHKDQILPRPEHGKPDDPEPAPRYTPAQTALKIYFTLVALGLIASTVLGVVMALQNRLRRKVGVSMLVLGTLVPILIVLL